MIAEMTRDDDDIDAEGIAVTSAFHQNKFTFDPSRKTYHQCVALPPLLPPPHSLPHNTFRLLTLSLCH
jgi:hypothetical protein